MNINSTISIRGLLNLDIFFLKKCIFFIVPEDLTISFPNQIRGDESITTSMTSEPESDGLNSI